MLQAKASRVVLALLAGYFVVVGASVVSVQRASNSVASADISQVLNGGTSEFSRLESDLAVFRRRFTNLRVLLYPVRQTSRVLFVIPPLDRQRQVSELLLERVNADHDIAISALKLGESFHSLRNEYLGDSFSLGDAGAYGLDASLVQLESEAEDLLDELTNAAILRTQISDLGPAGPVRAVDARMTAQEVRLEQIAEFSRLLSALLQVDLALISSADTTFENVELFLDGRISIDDLQLRITELSALTHEARNLAIALNESTPEGLAGTSEGRLVATVADLNVAMDDLFIGIGDAVGAAAESFELLGSGNQGLFSEGSGITATIEMLASRQSELGTSAELIVQGVDSLRTIRDEQVVSLGDFGELLDDPKLNKMIEMSEFLHQIPELVGEILGVDGVERKFLALGQTSDELRAAGGFTSSAWLLTFQSGALIRSEYFDVATFEDRESLDSYPESYEELQLHMDAGRMYLRDAGWDPNFPSAGVIIADIYNATTGTEIDGVISLTQLALLDLSAAIGGIEIDSQLVSSDELLSIMEAGTDADGTQYLTSLFDALLNSFSGNRVRENFVDLLTSTSALFASKDLMLFSTDPTTERLISNVGWSGEISDPPQDRLRIIDSNVGWNKVDRNITRGFKYSVDLTDLSRPEATLELSYFNNSIPADLSTNCDIQSHRPDTYDVLLNGCYWNYFRVYLPGGVRLLNSDKLPLEEGAIAARVGGLNVGRPTVQQMFDDNGEYISGLFALDSQLMQSVRFNYILPRQVLVQGDGYVEYLLGIGAQPGTRGRAGTVELKLPEGYEPVGFEPEDGIFADGFLTINLELVQDETVFLRLRNTQSVGS